MLGYWCKRALDGHALVGSWHGARRAGSEPDSRDSESDTGIGKTGGMRVRGEGKWWKRGRVGERVVGLKVVGEVG